jgi:hypothetical protein
MSPEPFGANGVAIDLALDKADQAFVSLRRKNQNCHASISDSLEP